MKMFDRARFMVLILLVPKAFAWGPHWDITRAAVAVLPTNHPLMQLGSEVAQLTNYCWLPDFKRLPFRSQGDDFYADDFLLFPGVTKHFDHICPEVEQTYAPYFRRALQAVRMESPPNAARWLGSLLHFVQDSGSPPHAAQIRGDMHIRMENWVDAKRIVLNGYEPRTLGTNEDDALRGLEARMKELIAFSKPRGQKLRTPVLLGNRRAVEPVALESALECARVTADVLHTVGTLGAIRSPGITLSGLIQSVPAVSEGRFAARILFHGTNISTLADAQGRFVLHGLRPGQFRVSIMRPGSATLTTNITLAGDTTNFVCSLMPEGNLVRNGDFSTRWLQTNAPDCWTRMNLAWEGEIIVLRFGQRYRVLAEFQPGSDNDVTVRWSRELPFALPKPARGPRIETRRLTRESPDFLFTANTNIALMQLSLRAVGHPTNTVRRLLITPVSE